MLLRFSNASLVNSSRPPHPRRFCPAANYDSIGLVTEIGLDRMGNTANDIPPKQPKDRPGAVTAQYRQSFGLLGQKRQVPSHIGHPGTANYVEMAAESSGRKRVRVLIPRDSL